MTPPGEASYVYAEDYCRTGPLYSLGTQIVLPRDVIASNFGVPVDEVDWNFGHPSSVNRSGRVLLYAKLFEQLPAGTVVEIVGPYVENGVCDWWPVRYQTEDGNEWEGYINEWDLSPEFPNQVAPLPPEWQSISREMEEFCLSNTDYAFGEVLVLTHETPGYSYRRGYGFEFIKQVSAGYRVQIDGSPIETGICDMWPVTTFRNSLYIHESDLRPAIP